MCGTSNQRACTSSAATLAVSEVLPTVEHSGARRRAVSHSRRRAPAPWIGCDRSGTGSVAAPARRELGDGACQVLERHRLGHEGLEARPLGLLLVLGA